MLCHGVKITIGGMDQSLVPTGYYILLCFHYHCMLSSLLSSVGVCFCLSGIICLDRGELFLLFWFLSFRMKCRFERSLPWKL